MNKRLFLTVLVAAMLALCLAGCGNSGGGAAEKPAAASSVATEATEATEAPEASAEKVVKDDGMPNLELLFQAYQAGGSFEAEALLSELPQAEKYAPKSYYCSDDDVAASFDNTDSSLSEGEWVIHLDDHSIDMYVPAFETDEDVVDAIARYTGAEKAWVLEGDYTVYFQCDGCGGEADYAPSAVANGAIVLSIGADDPNGADLVKRLVEEYDGPVKEYTL